MHCAHDACLPAQLNCRGVLSLNLKRPCSFHLSNTGMCGLPKSTRPSFVNVEGDRVSMVFAFDTISPLALQLCLLQLPTCLSRRDVVHHFHTSDSVIKHASGKLACTYRTFHTQVWSSCHDTLRSTSESIPEILLPHAWHCLLLQQAFIVCIINVCITIAASCHAQTVAIEAWQSCLLCVM